MSTEPQGTAPTAPASPTPQSQTPVFSTQFDESAPPKAPNTGLIVIAVVGVVLAGGGLAWNILGPKSAPAAAPPAPTVRTYMSEQTQMMREAMQMAREAQQMQREHMARIEAEMRGEYSGEYSGDGDGGGDPR